MDPGGGCGVKITQNRRGNKQSEIRVDGLNFNMSPEVNALKLFLTVFYEFS